MHHQEPHTSNPEAAEGRQPERSCGSSSSLRRRGLRKKVPEMNLERANSRSFSYSSRSNGSEALICESLRFLVRIIRTNSPERQYHAKSRILILLVFSLTVGLFCSEVPELLSQ